MELKEVSKKVILNIPEVDKLAVEAMLNTPLYQKTKKSGLQAIKFGDPVSVNGWDTVFEIRASYLNEAIIEKKSYPESMNYKDEACSLVAEFAAWQLTTGGGEGNVNIDIPVKKMSYTAQDGSVHIYENSTFTVQIRLAYFPEVLGKTTLKEGTYDLKLDPNKTDVTEPITVIGYEIPTADKYTAPIIAMLLEEWANLNLDAFNTVFSTVTLVSLSEHKGYEWLTTTYMSYGYMDGSTVEDSVFGVLCMTNNHSAPMNHNLTNILTEKDTSAFIINMQTYIEDVYAVELCEQIGIPETELKIEERSVCYESDDGKQLDDVKVGAINYHPYMKKMKVSFTQTEIITETVVKTTITPGVDSTSTIITHQTLALDTNSKGEQVLVYENLCDPSVHTETEISPWIYVTEALIAFIGTVVSGVIGAVCKKVVVVIVSLVVVAVVSAIVGIIIHVIIEQVVADGVVEGVPSVTPMIQMATNSVVWPLCDPSDENRYVLTDIKYAENLIFYGNPGFAI